MDGTRELDLLTDFTVTDVPDVSVTADVDDAITSDGTAGHAVLSLPHGSGHVSHLTTHDQIVDQVMNTDEDEMMDVMTEDGLRSTDCSGQPAGDHEIEDEDGEDEAMQFESAANKMFQSESQVVPLPTVRDINHQIQHTFVNNISISGINSSTSSNNGIISSGSAVSAAAPAPTTVPITAANTLIGNSSTGAKIISIPAASVSMATKSQVVTTSTGKNTILLPAGQSIPSAAELSNFITSIKPPAIPGVTGVQQQQISGTKQLILQKGTVLGTSQQLAGAKRTSTVPNIAPHPGIQLVNASGSATASANNLPPGSYKVIQLTSNGQQLAFVPAGTDASNVTAIRNSASVSSAPANVAASSTSKLEPAAGQKTAITLTGSGGQQIVFLSPLKSGTGQAQTALRVANASQAGGSGLKTLAPAPSGPVRVIQATSASSGGTQLTKDGKNVQFIRVVTSSGAGGGLKGSTTTTLRTIAPSSGQKTVTLVPASMAGKSGTNLLSAGQLLTTTTGTGNQQVIMLPASVLQSVQSGGIIRAATVPKVTMQNQSQQQQNQIGKSYIPIAPSPVGAHISTIHPSSKDVLAGLVKQQQQQQHQPQQLQHLNGPSKSVSMNSSIQSGPASVAIEDLSRQRKPCNCTKSQCLKLYCDCFANGEFCKDCNCNNCNNNLEHEEDRQKAVRQCLERNPQAFQPKIGKGRLTGDIPERRHTKGCNCRRSGCLKNYCECYEAKILCSELCKCSGCKNYEDSVERRSLQLMNLAEAAEYRSQQQSAASKLIWGSDYQAKLPVPSVSLNDRFPCSFISSDVIDATCQCLMATVEDCTKTDMEYEAIEKALLLEFGRCLSQIIEFANKSKT